jgi:hypothetical protein
MHHWTRRLFALATPLLLAGCLWGPGNFASDLTLRKNGAFVLDYRGELVLQLPPDQNAEPWTDAKAKCDVGGKARSCTKTEIADQKVAYEKKRAEAEQMAKMFGLPGLDDASNRAFAAKLTKYAGWRSVIYRGNGVFDVDYHFEGRATQDFLFPALPDNDLVIPFIAIRRRADGSVLVTAPAMTGGSGPLAMRSGMPTAPEGKGPVSRAQGRFTVITDGEILTNNSEDGAAAHPLGRAVHWDVSPASTKVPETLIRL